MPNVLNEFAGDGVTRTFTFSMTGGYLSRDYVYFYTRPNGDLLSYTPYDDANVTWVGDYTVQLSAPIPTGTTFVILRSTPLDTLVDFQNTSRITEKNLDTATQQSVHIAAESSDLVGRLEVVVKAAKEDAEAALLEAEEASEDASQAAQAATSTASAAGQAQSQAQQANAAAQAALLSAQASEALALQAGASADQATQDAASATQASSSAVATANAADIKAGQALTASGNAVSIAQGAEDEAANARGIAEGAVLVANGAAGDASSAVSAAASATQVANEAKALVDEAVSGAVVSFNGRSGAVLPQAGDYDKSMVGLGNVDNTADLDKPVSTAVNTALGAKASTTYVNTQLALKADKTTVNDQLALKADTSTVNNQLALKADKTYVDNSVALLATNTSVSNAIAVSSTADRNRANHTGTQAISTITGLPASLATIPTVIPKAMNCMLARSGTNQVTLYRAMGDTILIKGVSYQMPVTTNAATVLESAPYVYARVIDSVVSIYVDSSPPVFNNTYGQWVNPTNSEPYVGSAVNVFMETRPWLVRSMYNEPGVTFSMMHFSGDLAWDGGNAVVASETVVLLPGDILHATSNTSIGFHSSGIREFNNNLVLGNIAHSSQFVSFPGGNGLCMPSSVTLVASWKGSAKVEQLQTIIRRSAGGGLLWRPGAGSLDKTTVTIHRNY